MFPEINDCLTCLTWFLSLESFGFGYLCLLINFGLLLLLRYVAQTNDFAIAIATAIAIAICIVIVVVIVFSSLEESPIPSPDAMIVCCFSTTHKWTLPEGLQKKQEQLEWEKASGYT